MFYVTTANMKQGRIGWNLLNSLGLHGLVFCKWSVSKLNGISNKNFELRYQWEWEPLLSDGFLNDVYCSLDSAPTGKDAAVVRSVVG
jgi:hypothetical protein